MKAGALLVTLTVGGLTLASHDVDAATCPTANLCLNDTVTYSSTPGNQIYTYGNPTNGPIDVTTSSQSFGFSDAFGGSGANAHPVSPGTAFPTGETGDSNHNYNFYDDYYFTTTSALTDAAVISGFGANGIQSLQIRIFASDGQSGPLNGTPTIGIPSGGSIDGWQQPLGSNGSESIVFQTPLPAGTYDLQIRGLTSGSSSSYGGNLNLDPVPLPAAIPMLLSGLGLLGSVVRRRAPILAA
jgi:hypothetical protein